MSQDLFKGKIWLLIVLLVTHCANSVVIESQNQNLQIQCKEHFIKGRWAAFPSHLYDICIENPSSLRVGWAGMEINKVVENESEISNYSQIEAVYIKRASVKVLPNFKIKLTNLKAIELSESGVEYICVEDMNNLEKLSKSVSCMETRLHI